MADSRQKVTGFRDGRPVYKKYNENGRSAKSPSDRKSYGERGFDGGREGKRSFDRSDRKSYGERSFDRNERKDFGNRSSYDERQYSGRKKDNRFFEEKKDDRFIREENAFESSLLFGMEDEVEENGEQDETHAEIIMGRNPVKEAIKSGRSIDRILVTKEHDGSLGEIVGLARDLNLVIREVDRSKLDELCMPFGHNGKPGNHQGIVAEIPGVEYVELNDILEYAESRNEKPFIILLDGIEDPHNLGSIIRSAECAGAHGVVITKRRCASVTAAVVKTSAGAAEHMRCARVVNLGNAIDTLKEHGVWIAGADMDGKPMYDVDMKGAFALVIGSEGDGLSHLVKEKCDFLVSIPLHGKIGSLNAAVAGAIVMFEKNRQDAIK